MDPENTQTQVGGQPPMPESQPVPTPATIPVAPPPIPQVPVASPVPPIEKPAGGSSVVMRIAIWVLVIALLVVIAYAAYAYFVGQNTNSTYVPVATTVATEIPTPESTVSAIPLVTPPASTSSATPTSTPSATP